MSGSTYVANTWKYLRLVLLDTGALYYASDDGRTWSLLWEDTAGVVATLYPVVYSYNAACDGDYVRWRQAAVPAPLLSATPASPSPTQGGEMATGNLTVGNWYTITATQANYFYTSCAVDDYFRASAATALDANNKVVPITFATTLTGATDIGRRSALYDLPVTVPTQQQGGFVVALDDETNPANYLLVYTNRTNLTLVKCEAGTQTTLIDTATGVTYADARRIRLVILGTSVAAYYESSANTFTQIGTTQTVANIATYGTKAAAFGVRSTVSFGAWNARA